MKTISEILKKGNSPLIKLINKANSAQNLVAIFNAALDKTLAPHCHLANYENSVLTVLVANASMATRLRYAIPDILKNLRIQPEFKTITTIRYVISEQKPIQKLKKKLVPLSKDNEILLQKTLDDLKQKNKPTHKKP